VAKLVQDIGQWQSFYDYSDEYLGFITSGDFI